MEKLQTVPTSNSVYAFLDSVTDAKRRSDSYELLTLIQEETGEQPVLWGPAIIGFGSMHYKYASGREGDMPIISFSPRKNALTLYNFVFYERNRDLVEKLGPHTLSKACLYIKDLHAVDTDILRQMIQKTLSEPDLISNT